jgi:hypothetical protein
MKLIYFTLGNNPDYIKLANLCIKSLYKQNYDGDFLFITDLKNELLNTIKFNKDPIFIEVTKSNLMMSSSNKLKLYLYDRIFEYDSIIFSDLDILWTSNPKKIFDLLNEDKFFFSNENAKWYLDYPISLQDCLKKPMSFHYIRPNQMKEIYEKYKA